MKWAPVNRLIYILGISVFLIFILSLAFRIIDGRINAELAFINPLTNKFENEQAKVKVPFLAGREKKILLVLKRQLNGPVSTSLRNLAPETLMISSVFLSDGLLYVNFNRFFALQVTPELEKPFIQSLLLTINNNFPEVQAIRFTFGGREERTITGQVLYDRAFDPAQPELE